MHNGTGLLSDNVYNLNKYAKFILLVLLMTVPMKLHSNLNFLTTLVHEKINKTMWLSGILSLPLFSAYPNKINSI